MSKKTTQPLSDNTRKLIIIIAIVLVAVIVLSVALALILKEDVKTPANDSTDNSNSSTLAIKNGDFLYTSSDETSYPRTAVNWTKYGYKDGSGFESITSSDKSVMGVIDLSEDIVAEVKSDLAVEGINIDGLKVRKDLEATDENVYVIHNAEANAASILSDSASISSGASVKITVWLNLKQVKDGHAVIMIQKSTVSAKDENWYAYNFEISYDESAADENGWQSFEFYVFNRETSTKYIRVSVGLGDVYSNVTATGTLFVDDISYETVTANEYREQVDNDEEIDAEVYSPYKIIENEDITDDSKYYELVGEGTTSIDGTYASFADFKAGEVSSDDEEAYLPFTNRDDFLRDGEESGFRIYKVSNNGDDKLVGLRLERDITLAYSPIDKDHYHISFWVRVKQNDGHQATKANVYVQKQDADGEWVDLDSGSFTAITTSQDVDTDTNNGWVKYDIYLKPANTGLDTLSILFVLGNADGYTDEEIENGEVPNGRLYVTSPACENISNKDYSNASTGTYVKKLNLVGASASTSVTNGSFSDVNSLGDEPTSWTPVFAGDNAIYKDGLGNELDEAKREASLVEGSGISKNGTAVDDAQKNVLQITTNGTNFGYISNDITLSSQTVYVFSVLAQGTPHVYLIDTAKDRTEDGVIIARVESTASASKQQLLDGLFLDGYTNTEDDSFALGEGWARYYILYVTADETVTARLALFNGAIDAVGENATFATGTVRYDSVKMHAIGSYHFDTDVDDDAPFYPTVYTANGDKYQDAMDVLTGDNHDTIVINNEIYLALGDNAFVQPSTEKWEEMHQIVADSDKDDDGTTDDTTATTPNEIDWGLLMSVISSVLLVAALLIVFVIKMFQRKRPRAV